MTERLRAGEVRLEAYLSGIAGVLGHAGRAAPMRDYCMGLLLPGERKSIEPMAVKVRPDRARASHQAMHHLVANAGWDDAAVLRAVRGRVLPAIDRHGPVRFWHLDSIAFPKQGGHSVGVARQLGDRVDGKPSVCQVAVMLSAGNEHASLPIAYRLHLPQNWAEDPMLRGKAGVPDGVGFETEAATALDQVRQALAERIPAGVVRGGPRYGDDTEFRAALNDFGLTYALGARPSTKLWLSGAASRERGCEPSTAEALISDLPVQEWRRGAWREEGRTDLSSRFTALRVQHPARHDAGAALEREEWLLAEWPRGGETPRFWLANLPPGTALDTLVQTAKGGQRTRRDLDDLRQEIGLDYYEGRGWRGFHHHASLCIAAYGFLVLERCAFPPAQRFTPRQMAVPNVPWEHRPRGSSRALRATDAEVAGRAQAPKGGAKSGLGNRTVVR